MLSLNMIRVGVLTIISFPAGLLPFAAYHSYKEYRSAQQYAQSPKWREFSAVQDKLSQDLSNRLKFCLLAFVSHGLFLFWLSRDREDEFLNLKRGVWMLAAWLALATGAFMGVWLFVRI